MAIKHGVYVSERATSVSTPVVAECGIPFVIGAAPVQSAQTPAGIGIPVLCSSWDEFVDNFGYSDDWDSYNLCEFAYSHFKLYACQPVIFCNLLDPSTHRTAVAEASFSVSGHRVQLPISAIDDTDLVVKAGDPSATLVKDTDYSTFYNGEYLVVELISSSDYYDEATLKIAYDKVTAESVTANMVAEKIDAIDLCMSTVGTVPDLICAPGYSHVSTVAAIMATKAASLNGVFQAKAIIDIDSTSSGVQTYSAIAAWKASHSLTDDNMILCWPMTSFGGKKGYMSTHIAGLMAQVDAGNGCPYESPSNKGLKIDGLVLADGTAVLQTKAQADTVNSAGVVTALNFLSSGWVCWGNFCAGYPSNTDVKDYFIPVSRMFDWVGNTLVKTFWSKLDKPMNRRLLDNIVDSTNIWLNGLVGGGYLLGARVEIKAEENALTDLMAGIVKVHIYMTPSSPAQEIDFVLEYDVNYVTNALS